MTFVANVPGAVGLARDPDGVVWVSTGTTGHSIVRLAEGEEVPVPYLVTGLGNPTAMVGNTNLAGFIWAVNPVNGTNNLVRLEP